MKIIIPLLFVLTFLSPVPTKEQESGKISSARITFEFVSKKVKGSIEGFESQSNIDLENLENSTFKGSVKSKTLDTNNGLRNWSLRSGKYFDVDDYPEISFESKTVQRQGNALQVMGPLTIKDTKKEITITFKKVGNTLVGTTSIYSIDYGIKIKKKREDNLVNIKMVFDLKS